MNADVNGCLANINKSYKMFSFEGKPMTKDEVKAVLTVAKLKGYKTTDEIPESDINLIIKQFRN